MKTFARLAAVLLVALVALPALSETHLLLGGASYHWERGKYDCEVNQLAGVEHSRVSVFVFRNSYCNTATAVGYRQPLMELFSGNLELGATAGLVHGYGDKLGNSKVAPVVFPYAGIGWFQVGFLYDTALSFTLRIKLE